MYTEEEGYTKEKRKHDNFKRSFSLRNMHVLQHAAYFIFSINFILGFSIFK